MCYICYFVVDVTECLTDDNLKEVACFPLGESGNRLGKKMESMNHRAYPSVAHLLQVELTFQRFHNIPKQCHQLLSHEPVEGIIHTKPYIHPWKGTLRFSPATILSTTMR